MDDIFTYLMDMPTTISGYTVRDRNGDYNVFLNSRLSYERRAIAYKHEVEHIQEGDFYKTESADLIEIHAHKKRR